ncbi:MAG: OmpA family protein [bacterium]
MMHVSRTLKRLLFFVVVSAFMATGCATLYQDRDAARSAIDQTRRAISKAKASGVADAQIESAWSYLDVAVKELNFCRPIPARAAADRALAALGQAPSAPPPAELVEKLVFENDVFFDFDKDILKPRSVSVLEQILDRLQGNSELVVRLTGHTDSKGSDIYNVDLSRRRTLVVSRWLRNRGIAGSRITTKWFGESTPRTTNQTRAGRAENRRTEIDLVLLP